MIEIQSPDDETYDTLPFYAAVAVREVIVIDRDTKRPEVYRIAGTQCVALQPDPDGWLRSEPMGVRLSVVGHLPPRLVIEDTAAPATRVEI